MGCPTCGGVPNRTFHPPPLPAVWARHGGWLHPGSDEAAVDWVNRRGGHAYLTTGEQYGDDPGHPKMP